MEFAADQQTTKGVNQFRNPIVVTSATYGPSQWALGPVPSQLFSSGRGCTSFQTRRWTGVGHRMRGKFHAE